MGCKGTNLHGLPSPAHKPGSVLSLEETCKDISLMKRDGDLVAKKGNRVCTLAGVLFTPVGHRHDSLVDTWTLGAGDTLLPCAPRVRTSSPVSLHHMSSSFPPATELAGLGCLGGLSSCPGEGDAPRHVPATHFLVFHDCLLHPQGENCATC